MVVGLILGYLTGHRELLLMGKYMHGRKLLVGFLGVLYWVLILFLIFINDIDVSIGSRICKFADDTKLYRIVDDANDSSFLQNVIWID